MKKILLSVLMLALVSPLLAGCSTRGGGEKSGEIVVAFVPKLTGNAFFEAANAGAQAYAQRHGFTVDYRGSDVADVSSQIAILEELIEEGVDAICVSSLDNTALDGTLKRAMKAGIKVVTWDADVSGDARSLMVSQGTPDQLGRMLVEMGAKGLEERGLKAASDPIQYAWHYSQASVADQNSWHAAGEAYIRSAYPNWINVTSTGSYYSGQDAEQAVAVGERVFSEHPYIDLVICNDSTALPGQAQAARNRGLTAEDVTITGFASPAAMRTYCQEDIVRRWGLWDCQLQGALGCYLAYYLASGNTAEVGDQIDVPDIGIVEIMPNTVLDSDVYTAADSGTVLLPSRIEFTKDNMDAYDF